MKIYISGQITGLKEGEAVNNFARACIEMEARGHDTVNPLVMGACFPGMDWKTYMTIAYGIINDPSVNAIYMLQNWTESTGAIMEWSWAQARGIPILYQEPEHCRKYERSNR